jgi:hypothetical protein
VAADFHTKDDGWGRLLDTREHIEVIFLELVEDFGGLVKERRGFTKLLLGVFLEGLSLFFLRCRFSFVLGNNFFLFVSSCLFFVDNDKSLGYFCLSCFELRSHFDDLLVEFFNFHACLLKHIQTANKSLFLCLDEFSLIL